MLGEFIDTGRVSRRLGAGVLCLFGWSVGVYTLAYHNTSHFEAKGPHQVLLEEFGGRAPITQTFTMPTDGLDAVRVLLSASGTTDIVFEWKLSEQLPGNALTPLYRNRQSVHMAAGQRWETIAFSPIVNSANKSYKLELQLIDAHPQALAGAPGSGHRAVAIVASLDRTVRRGFLMIGDRGHWGDLVFDTHSLSDTILGRFRLRTAPGLPAPLQRESALWAGLLFYNLMLAAFVIQFWPVRGWRVRSEIPANRRRRTAHVIAVSSCLAAALIAVYTERGRPARVDLIDGLYAADLQSGMPMHAAFDVIDEESVGGETMPAIAAHPPSQITWTVSVPVHVTLRTALLIDPGAWPMPFVDGVVFRIGVSEGGQYSELFMDHIDPAHLVQHRRWTPVEIDMSQFSGRQVQLIFWTDPSMPGQPPNPRFDWALWGAPRLVDN